MRTSRVLSSISAAVAVCLFAAAAATHKAEKPESEAIPKALDTIEASEMRAAVSFLASDKLEGRFTPSPGLDVAAGFIASEFQRAGLEPVGDQGYFQTATLVRRERLGSSTGLVVQDGARTFSVPAREINVLDAARDTALDNTPLLALIETDPTLLSNIDLRGRAVAAPIPDFAHLPKDRLLDAHRKFDEFNRTIVFSGVAALILIGDRHALQKIQRGDTRLLSAYEVEAHKVPTLLVSDKTLQAWIRSPETGSARRSLSVRITAPVDAVAVLKNVVGILRGSDPKLRDTYVMLTAHYDHLGTNETAGRLASSGGSARGDHIYNGANDDASGTASVIEVARALARLPERPKRSFVFVAFFGEERGEWGSRFYCSHPIFPISETVADVNLEQMGRTDSTHGVHLNSASLTGYDYSEVGEYLSAAGRRVGIKVYRDPEASDAYFARGDNDSLASLGIPAHTLVVAFDFPDYHAVGDEWQKIDYDNMARVDRMVSLGILDIANGVTAPQWDASNPRTAEFRAAQQKWAKLESASIKGRARR